MYFSHEFEQKQIITETIMHNIGVLKGQCHVQIGVGLFYQTLVSLHSEFQCLFRNALRITILVHPKRNLFLKSSLTDYVPENVGNNSGNFVYCELFVLESTTFTYLSLFA